MDDYSEQEEEYNEEVYEQKFYGKFDFVGKIFGKGKLKLRTFCKNINENFNCKVSVKWIKNANTKGHWCVRSTNELAVDNVIKWLVNSELSEWRNIVEEQVYPIHKFKKEFVQNKDEEQNTTI